MPNERPPQIYAQAIFEQAAQDWLTPLKKIAGSLPPDAIQSLDNPALPFAKKQETLARVLGPKAPSQVSNFLSLLASKNEMHLLPDIIEEFDRYAQRGGTHSVARVTSAVTLTDEEKRLLEQKIGARFGKETEYDYVVDPNVIGGVVVRLGDKVIDGSVSGRLAALREKLK